MYLLSIEEWISTVFVKSLGWTFTHSLWQALLVLLVTYTILAMMKKAKPALRYNLLLFISMVFIVVVITTFIFQLKLHSVIHADKMAGTNLKDLLQENSAAAPVIFESKRIVDILERYFNNYLHLLVAAWFIIFCVKWLRLTLSLNYVNRISRFESTPANQEWQAALTELKNKLGVSIPVKLLQSNIVKVPLVTGLIKPMILVPAGMLLNMPPDLIESILLHELSHIRRRDYMVNILQSAVETIFFFNPFILKLSNLVREEREACCDEMAVDATKNKITYVEALVAFGKYSTDHAPALAFAGPKNHLLQRVKRILYNQNKKPGIMEKSILFCSVITMFLITAFTSVTNENKPEIPLILNEKYILKDTVPEDMPEAEEPVNTEKNKRKKKVRENEERLEKKEKELKEVQIDLEFKQHQMQQDIQKTIQLQQEKVQKLVKEMDFQKHIDIQKINKEMQLVLESRQFEYNKEMAAQMAQQMQMQKGMLDSLTQNLKLNLNVNTQLKLHEDVSGLSVVSEVLNFLENNDVADVKDIKSFTLNETELIVNGKKQSSSLHQQLKEKYIGRKDDYINYSNSGGNKSISIQLNDPDSD